MSAKTPSQLINAPSTDELYYIDATMEGIVCFEVLKEAMYRVSQFSTSPSQME
jgi:hypothetical protein